MNGNDRTISRIIKVPRASVWNAWANPGNFEQWWIPEPLKCRVVDMDLRPGGAFVTQMSEDGATYTPHMNACFLAADALERIVFTNALTGGWRPAEDFYPVPMTAIITLRDHAGGTEYSARVLHRNEADRKTHSDMGFQEGWGTVLDQLARKLESRD